MDELRKKLIYMIENHCAIVVADACPESSNGKCTIRECATCLANHLIANGVTVQESKGVEIDQFNKWIPVTERLPNPSTYVLALTAPGYLSVGQNCVVADYIHPSEEEHGVFVMAYRYWEDPLKVTHWMPLPEPPKGE